MAAWNDPKILDVLSRGGVVVMPTDTIYGLVGRAEDAGVVERIYRLRNRAPEKPCIILVGGWDEIKKFGVDISKIKIPATEGPTSFVLDCAKENSDKFKYLHRGKNTLAFRLPKDAALQKLLLATGPLTAPSANTEGDVPAQNITEAKKYFGEAVDLYVDEGEIIGSPSKVVRLYNDGSSVILRE